MKNLWQIELLGTFRLRYGTHLIHRFPTRKAALLLAYLASTNTFHSRQHLAAQFWPNAEEATAAASLRVALNSLRKILGQCPTAPELLSVDRLLVGLTPDTFQTDLQLFENLRRQLSGCPEPGKCKEILRKAVNLYAGSFLGGYEDVEGTIGWITTERLTLEAACVHVLHHLAELELETGEERAALDTLLRASKLDPMNAEIRRLTLQTVLRLGEDAVSLWKRFPFFEESQDTSPAPKEAHKRLQSLSEYIHHLEIGGLSATWKESNAFVQTLEWTFALMPERTLHFCRSLSVFRDCFTAKQAKAVSADPKTESLLCSLVESGLISFDNTSNTYRWLPAARTSLYEQLSTRERRQAEKRMMSCLLHEARELNQWFGSSDQEAGRSLQQYLNQITIYDTVLAWAFGEGQEITFATKLLCALGPLFLSDAGRSPHWKWVIEMWEGREKYPPVTYRMILKLNAELAHREGNSRFAVQAYRELLALARNSMERSALANTLDRAGVSLMHSEQDEEAQVALEEALAIYTEMGIEYSQANVLANLGDVHRIQKSYALAETYYQRAIEIYANDEMYSLYLASALYRYAVLKRQCGQYDAARRMLNDCLRLRQKHHEENGIAECLREIGGIALEQGYFGEARINLERCQTIFRSLEKRDSEAGLLLLLGDLERAEGDTEKAECLYQSGLSYWQKKGHRRWSEEFQTRLDQNA